MAALSKNLLRYEAEQLEMHRDVDREFENRLRKAVPVPILNVKKPFFEREKETGYLAINVKESTARIVIGICTFIGVALLGWVANLLQIFQTFFK